MAKGMTNEQKLVLDLLRQRPMGATEIIETLCTGPQEGNVRRAIWSLLYDQGIIDLKRNSEELLLEIVAEEAK